MNDLRFAFRQLLKHPGFTTVAVLTLALGIGATTAIVSLVQTAIFDPLPVPHPERLIHLGNAGPKWNWSPGINASALRDARRETNLFARIEAHYLDILTLTGEDFPQPVRGAWVTPGFFGLWQARPQLGRTFAPDEGHPAQNSVLVISHSFWLRQFGGNPTIIGRTVPFRERPMTVIGVMPPHFSYPQAECEFWRPAEDIDPLWDKHGLNLHAMAELLPGVTTGQVQAFLDLLTQRQLQNDQIYKSAYQARDLRERFSSPEVRRTLNLLLGAIVFVLLIASANVAHLQLARTETRQQELALRAALGAGRTRVFRQLLTESLLLALLGGAAGLAVSAIGLDLLQKIIPATLPRLKPIGLNLAVLGISSAVTLATGLLFGLAPAWHGWRTNLSEGLKLSAATGRRDRRHGRFSQALIVGQLALVLVLLTGAGLMVRSAARLLQVNPGLDPKQVVRIYPWIEELERRHGNPDPLLDMEAEASFAFFADARQRVAAIPGVVSVGIGFDGRKTEVSAEAGPLPNLFMKYWVGIEEADPLRVLRVPLKQGRWLDRRDVGEGVHSVLVNETAARQLAPAAGAVGKLFQAIERGHVPVVYEIVGVVGDTRDYGPVAPLPTFYRALQKDPGVENAAMFLIVRTASEPSLFYKPIGQALKAAGADPKMPEFYNLDETLRSSMAGHRTVMLYLGIFAGVGLLLAGLGLYGVLAFSVARRTREIGVRMALGAQIADVIRLILRQGLLLAAAGSVIGVIIALASGRLLRAYLFGVSATDPLTLIAVVFLLGAVALIACWVPARRAAKIHPMEALRHE